MRARRHQVAEQHTRNPPGPSAASIALCKAAVPPGQDRERHAGFAELQRAMGAEFRCFVETSKDPARRHPAVLPSPMRHYPLGDTIRNSRLHLARRPHLAWTRHHRKTRRIPMRAGHPEVAWNHAGGHQHQDPRALGFANQQTDPAPNRRQSTMARSLRRAMRRPPLASRVAISPPLVHVSSQVSLYGTRPNLTIGHGREAPEAMERIGRGHHVTTGLRRSGASVCFH